MAQRTTIPGSDIDSKKAIGKAVQGAQRLDFFGRQIGRDAGALKGRQVLPQEQDFASTDGQGFEDAHPVAETPVAHEGEPRPGKRPLREVSRPEIRSLVICNSEDAIALESLA